MRWVPVGKLELKYTDSDEMVSFSPHGDGQVYGFMVGRWEGPELSGAVHVTNTAPRRTDGIFEPRLRGLLTTAEGDKLYLRIDGLSIRPPEGTPNVRLVPAWVRLRSDAERYRRWNAAFVIFEGRGGPVDSGWGVSGPLAEAQFE
jgi:hypothetical protein